jgi:hypothetical protein
MVIAVIAVMRRPVTASPKSPAATRATVDEDSSTDGPGLAETIQTASTEDIEAYLAEQQANLAPFELPDLSNSFKGTTQEHQRAGIVLHVTDSDTALVAFSCQIFNAQNGVISAETTYGKMELIVTQGRAGVKWDGQPIGILDYSNQRILGPEGQLLGNMERPAPGTGTADGDGYYPIGFFGQKAADVNTQINALSTLRWFGNEGEEQAPAFKNLASELDDNQTLLLLAALLLEMGFLNLL